MNRVRLTPRWAAGGDPVDIRTLFGAQLFMVAAVAVPVTALSVVDPVIMRDVRFMGAVGLLGLATIAVGVLGAGCNVALIGWCLALADLVACLGMYASAPISGFGVVLMIPVGVVASFYTKPVVITTASLAALGVAGSIRPSDTARIPSALTIMVLIGLVAAAAYALSHRIRAQQSLLLKQASLLTASVTRAKVHERTLTTVLDALDASVSAILPTGEVLMTNTATAQLAARLRGQAPATAAGAPFAPETGSWLPGLDDALQRIMDGEDVSGEILWAGSGGGEQAAVKMASRRVVLDGHEHVVVVIAEDVTDDVLSQQAREQFTASVTHEFRTPLTSIIGYLDLVMEEDLPDETTSMLEVASANADRLLMLANDFLDGVSRSTATGFSLVSEDCRLAELVERSVESLRPYARGRGIAFSLGPLDDVVVQGDPLRLGQVFDNLVSNAVKYNADGGSVWIQVHEDDDHGVITIRDSGRGMSEEEVTRMFNRFYRSSTARDSTVPGTGLGMDIARVIIEKHGGDIAVSSALAEGTSVMVRLPIAGPVGEESDRRPREP